MKLKKCCYCGEGLFLESYKTDDPEKYLCRKCYNHLIIPFTDKVEPFLKLF